MNIRVLFEVDGEILDILYIDDTKAEGGELSRWHPSYFYPGEEEQAFFQSQLMQRKVEPPQIVARYSLSISRRRVQPDGEG